MSTHLTSLGVRINKVPLNLHYIKNLKSQVFLNINSRNSLLIVVKHVNDLRITIN